MADDIRQWLEELGLGKYGDVFVENDVDLEVLPDLEGADLESLGVSLGHRKKLLRAVARQFSDAGRNGDAGRNDATATGPMAGAGPAAAQAEHRQLTVMFVDLVGSTALSRRLEPEQLRDILRAYQNAVSGEVTQFDGYLASFMGDGVLAYFGWPKAYEDQAERAAYAALGIVEAVRALKFADQTQLELRLGIASGQVVVGDLIGEGGSEVAAVTGETPNLASRLQEFAMPGQIVISDSTKRLIGNAFELNGMGSRLFKGFAEPMPVWRLLAATGTKSRFEALRSGNVLPLVGRKAEMGLLLDRWELAKSGNGQTVFVSGEAGIGKSRLVQALRERVTDEPHFWVRCQASPYHTASALYPMARQLEQAAGIDDKDTAGDKRQKLERLLKLSRGDIMPHLQALAPLLSIPLGDDDIGQTQTAEQRRERMIETLIDQLVGLSRRRPTLFVFEDAHWVDPSTDEALARMTQRIADEAVIVLITHRPEWRQSWATGHDHVAQLALPRLGSVHAAEIVRRTAGDAADDETIARIAERTDGVPLFIEELTRSIYQSDGASIGASGEIPETLQGLLLARLDQLEPDVRELGQIGAVIGREFSADLLSETSGRKENLDGTLARLMASHLVYQSGSAKSQRYVFRHALIQEAAYNSLLVRRREEYHNAIARALEREHGDGSDIPPELVAQHYAASGDVAGAVPWCLKAGERARERSANLEAVEHLQRGVTLAEELPEGEESLRLQLKLHLELGHAATEAGELEKSLAGFNQAACFARLVKSDIDLARAAIGFEQAEYFLSNTEIASVELLQEAISRLSGAETVELCSLLGSQARAYSMAGLVEKARKSLAEAVAMARRLGDKRALFEAVFFQFYMTVIQQMVSTGPVLQELHSLAQEIGDWTVIMRAESWRAFYYLQAGDRDQFDASLQNYRSYADRHQNAVHIMVAMHGGVIGKVLAGDFDAAEEAAEEAFAAAQRMRMESAHGIYGTQMFTIRREQGRLAEVAPVFKMFVDDHPEETTWRPGLALIASDLGFLEPARKAFDEMAADGFKLAHDAKRSTTLSYLAEVCSRLDDRPRAKILYQLLLPYADLTISMGITTMCYGAAARYLGLLATTLEDWQTAATHFELAIEKDTGFRAWPWLAHSQVEYAAMLQKRGRPGDRPQINKLLETANEATNSYGMVLLNSRIEDLQQQ